jgi:hypothetical protein
MSVVAEQAGLLILAEAGTATSRFLIFGITA